MFEIDIDKKGNTAELVIQGEVNSATAGKLDEAVKSIEEKHIILDMAGIEYMSSAGLRVIAAAHSGLDEAGGRLELRNITDAVMEILDMSGFTTFLNIIE